MCDCSDAPKAFCETTRKARKEHRCCECGAVIPVGEKYEYVSGVWDAPMAFKTCQECAALRAEVNNHLTRYDCGPCYGDLIDAARDMGLAP